MVLSVVAGPMSLAAASTAPAVNGGAAPVAQVGATGDALYRVNAGGPTLSATDGGPDWAADTASDPSEYHNPTGDLSEYSVSDSDGSVPASTPTAVFESARWDASDGEELQWEFPIQADGTYEVRLYFADGYADAAGERVFDVAVEGDTVLDDYDIVADVGKNTGTMKSFSASVTDGTLDVDFAHASANNPIVSAIEVVRTEGSPNELGVSSTAVDFGAVVTGGTATETVTLTNLGGADDPTIDVSDLSIDGDAAFDAQVTGDTTLAPGESTTVEITYAPSATGESSATLAVPHSGTDSPATIDLSGSGTNDVEVSFGASTISGADLNSPSSLDFGPDGRLYVAERYGVVKAFDVERQGENDYQVTASETVAAINDLQNHNDDGSADGVPDNRQLTGITVEGTAENPVVYATSSDPRHYSSPQGDRSEIMDTNSGVLSRIAMQDDGSWEHVALVRGLPRSTELHSSNGLQLDEATDTLFIAQGGNSGSGAPNDKFSYTVEYAYSAAVLSVDLGAVESMSTKTDTGTVPYKYDLPTLDPSVSVAPDDTPFGGLGGQNMAVLTEDSPVQVYASGLRNPYDVTLTDDAQLYATDNGVGGGWGVPPIGEGTNACTNEPNSGGTEDRDQLHLIEEDGYYGHPNPTRGNPDGAGLYDIDNDENYEQIGADDILADAVPSPDPRQCDYLEPNPDEGQEDGSLTTFGSSTNGIDEYAASNFGDKMQGDLLTASFDGNVRRIQLNGAGDAVTDRDVIFSSGLATPLDVHAQGDEGPFPGTAWVADFGDGDVHVYEPADYDGSVVETCDPSDPAGDADGDGYTNGDEQAVGTDPCSAADTPNDYDDDGVPNEIDGDDDDDGLPDTSDPFAVDPDNGATTQVPVDCPSDETVSTEACLRFQQSSFPGTILDLGFTGLMTNGQDDYADLHDPSNVQAGGAADTLGMETITGGSAYQSGNTQEYGYQYGVSAPDEPFVIHSRIVGGFDGDVPPEYWNYGIHFGDGTQSNYAKLVIGARGAGDADGEVEFVVEEDDSATSTKVPESGVVGNNVELYMTVDPTTDPTPTDGSDDVAVTVEYAISTGERIQVGDGAFAVPAAWVTGDSTAVGVVGTSTGTGDTYPASYDLLEVERTAEAPEDSDPEASVAITPDGDVDASSWGNDAFAIENTGDVPITSVDIDTSSAILPDLVFDPEGTAGDGGDKSFELGSASDDVGLGSTADADIFGQPHNGVDGDDGYERMSLSFTDFESGETLTFGSDGDPTSIKGGSDVQQDGAGPVSGAEFAGATVTVAFADGTTETVRTFGDGSAGGSAAVTSADQSDDVTLGLQDGTLDADALDARHSAATVADTEQTVTVTGPAGATVTVMQADTELNLDGVPTYDGTPGYDVEAYEGNNFVGVTYHEVTLGADGTATIDVTVPAGDAQQAYFVAAVENGDGTTGAPSNVVVLEQGQPEETPTDGRIVYRVNAGGETIQAFDENVDWESDTQTSPSQYRTSAGGDASQESGPDGDTVTIQDVVPGSTPTDLYQSTRFDQPDGSEMQWGFPVEAGSTYEVRVYVAETYIDDANAAAQGPREYDVSIEGETVLDDYDMYEELGHDVGSVKTFEVTPTDDTLNVDFLHELENPMIAGLEVVKLNGSGGGSDDTAEASVAVTPASGVDASTWSNDAYQIENTGEVDITSVSIDTSSTVLPDLVFDPEGTAGDGGDKSFQAGTDDGVGLGSTADADIFGQPHNGVDGDDGYERMNLTFTDFGPGETLTFGSDGDPTSIKGGSSVQQGEAGPVSGAELAGATITVEFADGTTETVRTFGDGSAGGSAAVTSANQSTAPTLGVANVTLDEGALDARHSAATVADTEQTLTVGGPAGATVTVMQADTELNLDGVPTYDGTPGYDVEAYEGNNFVGVTYHEVTLGADGTATIDVTVPAGDAQQAYFVAAVENGDGTTGAPSNVVVLEQGQPEETGPGPVGDFADAPTDPDGDGVYEDVNGDGTLDSADVTALFANLGDGEVQDSPDAFDVNGDGSVNSADVTALFAQLQGGA